MVRSGLMVALVAACGGASPRPAPTPARGSAPEASPPIEIVAGRADAATREPAGEDGDRGTIGGPGVGAAGGGALPGPSRQPVPTVKVGAPATGNADKEVVRRVVRAHINEIRTCYEAALLKHPDLSGTVIATFEIAPDGSVANATAAGLHPDVETCIAARIVTWSFPSPSSGGSLHINYPFVMRQEN